MAELTLKDRKLLYLLHENCRLSNTKMGKLIALSKDGVKYKIDRLFEQNIIQSYYFNIDYEKMGYVTYIVLLRLQKINSEKQGKIAETISKKKHVTYCAVCFGTWDMFIEIVASSVLYFEKYMNEIIKLLGNKLVNYQTIIAVKIYKPYENIIPEYFENITTKYKADFPKDFNKIKIDNVDKKILVSLSKDARMPLFMIAKRCDRSLDVIRYRLKRIEDSGLINSYQILIDNQKIGYSMNALFLRVHNFIEEREHKLARFLKEHDNIRWAYKALGQQIIVVETLTKSREDLQELITLLKNQFSDIITSYESVLEFKKYKDTMLPDLDELG